MKREAIPAAHFRTDQEPRSAQSRDPHGTPYGREGRRAPASPAVPRLRRFGAALRSPRGAGAERARHPPPEDGEAAARGTWLSPARGGRLPEREREL